MPFMPLPVGTNLYAVNILVIASYILYAFIGTKSKQNFFIGIGHPGSLLDPKIWVKVNRRFAKIIYLFSLPLLIANIIFFILKLPTPFAGTILIIFAIGMISISNYAWFYAENLTKEKHLETKRVKRPLYTIIILIMVRFATGQMKLTS